MSTITSIDAVEEIDIPEGYGFLSIPDSTGDTRIMWNPRDRDEVATAEAAFNEAKRKGMTAFKVDANTGESSGEKVTRFDKNMGKIIMVRQLVGG